MKRLSSGIRYGAVWPVALLNTFEPAVRAAGLFPRIADPAHLESVETQLGRRDRSSPWIVDGRSVRLRSFDEDAHLSLFGALAVRTQMRRCLRTTLELDKLIENNPQILKEKIERPLFIVGWPRTGTTLLQRLLCLNSDARFIPVWEAYDIIPERNGRRLTIEERRAHARRGMALLDTIAPALKAIHPMGIDDPDECYHLFRNYLAMPLGLDFARLTGYWEWIGSRSVVPAYEAHRRQLQMMQFYDRRGHWVLKSPQHLFGLPALLQVYPDANIVYTQRDPVEAIASYCSMMTVLWGMTSNDVDPHQVGRYALQTAARCREVGEAALAKLPKGQVHRVAYTDLKSDPKAVVTAIQTRFGYPVDEGMDNRMSSWLASNPADRHGAHTYNLADFGLTRQEVMSALGGGVVSGAAA